MSNTVNIKTFSATPPIHAKYIHGYFHFSVTGNWNRSQHLPKEHFNSGVCVHVWPNWTFAYRLQRSNDQLLPNRCVYIQLQYHTLLGAWLWCYRCCVCLIKMWN